MKRILVVAVMLVVAQCGWTSDYVYSGSGAAGIWNDANNCGGGGRVVIRTGADVTGKVKTLKDKTIKGTDPVVQELNSFTGKICVDGGVNIFNASDKTGDPLQFEASHGAKGTVRFLRDIPAPGLLLFIR